MNRPSREGGRAKLNRPERKRKLGDSNPRYGNPYGSLANCWFQPLTQTSLGCPEKSTFSQMRVQRYELFFFLPNFSNKIYKKFLDVGFLASPKALSLGKTKKNLFSFGFPLAYSYLWLTPKALSLGKTKKNGFSFGFPLAYSYLCTDSNGIKGESRHYGSTAAVCRWPF